MDFISTRYSNEKTYEIKTIINKLISRESPLCNLIVALLLVINVIPTTIKEIKIKTSEGKNPNNLPFWASGERSATNGIEKTINFLLIKPRARDKLAASHVGHAGIL